MCPWMARRKVTRAPPELTVNVHSGRCTDTRRIAMCMSCGCGDVNEDHGDDRNITREDLARAAAAADTTPEQAAENIQSCC